MKKSYQKGSAIGKLGYDIFINYNILISREDAKDKTEIANVIWERYRTKKKETIFNGEDEYIIERYDKENAFREKNPPQTIFEIFESVLYIEIGLTYAHKTIYNKAMKMIVEMGKIKGKDLKTEYKTHMKLKKQLQKEAKDKN